MRGWLEHGEGLGRLVGSYSDGLVYLWTGEALCLEELNALSEGCILSLVSVSVERTRERERLAFGSFKNATALLSESIEEPLDSHSASGYIFLLATHPSLRSVMFRLAAHRAVAQKLAPSSRALLAWRYARCRTITCVPKSTPAFALG